MRKTQIRAFIGTVFAIVVLIVFAAIAASAMGKDIPILRDISRAIGM
jgi:ABC-type phosphate/phosphonate transport system permease subunit